MRLPLRDNKERVKKVKRVKRQQRRARVRKELRVRMRPPQPSRQRAILQTTPRHRRMWLP
jgi:hypothetical protein